MLADTSYSSCCVDEVAAQHVDADVIVHYGHACMSLWVSSHSSILWLIFSSTSRLPVIYVFGQNTIDIDLCVQKLVEAFDADNPGTAILLKHDVTFTHQAGTLNYPSSIMT